MATYRLTSDGSLIDKSTGEQLIVSRGPIKAPMIVSDIEPYRSPVTGEVIGGRAQKRDDLKKHDCVDTRELRADFGKRRGVRSEKWANRLNLPLIGRDI
jgi:hypothetical protein